MTFKLSFNQVNATAPVDEVISLMLQKMCPSVTLIPFGTWSPLQLDHNKLPKQK